MTTTAIPRPGVGAPAHDINTDTPARDYIRSLARGVKPPTHPADFGQWEHIITLFEEKFDKYKKHGKQGDKLAEEMNGLINNLREFNPSLDELLAPTVDEIIAAEPPEPLFPPLPPSAYIPPEVSKGACNWLNDYIAFSRESSEEGYDEFHTACGLWFLSSVAARRVYIPIKKKKVYTNLMIAMCAETSTAAKSTTAEVAISLLQDTKLRYMLGPNIFTPQKLLSSMAGKDVPNDYTKYTPERKEYTIQKLGMPAQKCLYVDEFGKYAQSMLRKNSTDVLMQSVLLELNGCPDQFEVATVIRGSEPIQQPYLTLLGSMTYSNLKHNAKSGADFWNDGFWARFSFIAAPPKIDTGDSQIEAGDLETPAKLIDEIKAWHVRLGIPECYLEQEIDEKTQKETGKYTVNRKDLPEDACTINKQAQNAWNNYRNALKRMMRSFSHSDFNGSYKRLSETALRCAVLFASLENNNHIEMRHWAKGQEIAEIFRKNLHMLYVEVNTGNASEKTKFVDEIINELERFKSLGIHGMTPAVLRAKSRTLQSYGSVTDLHEALVKMEKANVLVLHRTPHAPKGKYFLVGDEPQEEKEEKPKK